VTTAQQSALLGLPILLPQNLYVTILCIVMVSLTDLFWCVQGEVEHQISKNRYRRTSRKPGFEGQIANIERRQARLKRIKQRLQQLLVDRLNIVQDPIAEDFDSAYSVGKSQHQAMNINAFVQNHLDDPAVVVSGCRFFPNSVDLNNNALGFYPEVEAPPSASNS
jgi:hypothetical protein